MYIVVDLDSTLLNNERQVSEYTLKRLNEIRSQGHLLIINTARSLSNSLKIIDIVKPDYSILNGGSLVVDKQLNVIYKNPFGDNLHNIINELQMFGKKIALQTINVLYTTDSEYKAQNVIFKDLKQNKVLEEVYKIIFICEEDNLAYSLAKKYNIECINYLNGPWYRLTPMGVTKFSGIENLLKIINGKMEDVIAFGDDYSDLEMLLKVGHGVAMKDSIPEVYEKIKYHADSCDEDGVVRYLDNYFSKAL